MAATRATLRGLPRRHRRVWKSRMAGLWRVAVTVAMYSIVRTEARPPQTRCLLLHFFLLQGKLALKKPGLTLWLGGGDLGGRTGSVAPSAAGDPGAPAEPRGPQCGRRPFRRLVD